MTGAEVVYNLGADEVTSLRAIRDLPRLATAIAAHIAPTSSCPVPPIPKKQGLFVNTEGRPQLALRAGFAPGEAKENWAILRALSAELGATLAVRFAGRLAQGIGCRGSASGEVDQVAENDWQAVVRAKWRMRRSALRSLIST